MSYAKPLVQKMLSSFGYELRSKNKRWWIPEMSSEDSALLDRVRPYTMTSPARLWATVIAVRHVVRNKVEGDFVECGVWRGGQTMVAALAFLKEGELRPLHLFDTFAGMTKPTAEDARNGELAMNKFIASVTPTHNEWCCASKEDVQQNMKTTDYDPSFIRLIKGPVEVTLSDPSNVPERIAILRLDTDWYASTRVELEALYPRLMSRGVLLIDDYGEWNGARKAVDEYFAERGIYPLLQPIDHTGRMYIKYDDA